MQLHFEGRRGKDVFKKCFDMGLCSFTECLSSQRYFVTFLSVFLLTVVLGLGILAVLRIMLRRKEEAQPDPQNPQFATNKKVCVSLCACACYCCVFSRFVKAVYLSLSLSLSLSP